MWGYLSFMAALISGAALIGTVRARRAYERELARLSEEVDRAKAHVRRRAQLAQDLAHEIKNPLAAIVSSAETLDLMLRDEIAPAHREALGYIREYGMDLLKQLSDFLDLNRAEGGYVIPQPQLVEIGRAAEAVCGLLQSAAHKRQVTLQVESGRVTQVARIDPGHLKQVLFNLVHNAVKFSPVGGLVEVVVQPVGTSGLISISVTDEGPGVPEDQKQQIFEPYIQGGIPCPSGERGTGLGLALCKTLVELAGGSIAVHSSVAHGSTFVVMLQGDVTQVREPETFETRLESVH